MSVREILYATNELTGGSLSDRLEELIQSLEKRFHTGCEHLLLRGPKQGEKCGKSISADSITQRYCQAHYKRYELAKEPEIIVEESSPTASKTPHKTTQKTTIKFVPQDLPCQARIELGELKRPKDGKLRSSRITWSEELDCELRWSQRAHQEIPGLVLDDDGIGFSPEPKKGIYYQLDQSGSTIQCFRILHRLPRPEEIQQIKRAIQVLFAQE